MDIGRPTADTTQTHTNTREREITYEIFLMHLFVVYRRPLAKKKEIYSCVIHSIFLCLSIYLSIYLSLCIFVRIEFLYAFEWEGCSRARASSRAIYSKLAGGAPAASERASPYVIREGARSLRALYRLNARQALSLAGT